MSTSLSPGTNSSERNSGGGENEVVSSSRKDAQAQIQNVSVKIADPARKNGLTNEKPTAEDGEADAKVGVAGNVLGRRLFESRVMDSTQPLNPDELGVGTEDEQHTQHHTLVEAHKLLKREQGPVSRTTVAAVNPLADDSTPGNSFDHMMTSDSLVAIAEATSAGAGTDATTGVGFPVPSTIRVDPLAVIAVPGVPATIGGAIRSTPPAVRCQVPAGPAASTTVALAGHPNQAETSSTFYHSGLSKRPWTREEDDKLLELVKKHGCKDWTQICSGLKTRNRKQCRERYKNHLCRGVKKGSWTQEEDNLIFEWQKKVGNKWSIIAQHLPHRTDNAIKNRFWSATRSKQRKARKEAKKRASALKEHQQQVGVGRSPVGVSLSSTSGIHAHRPHTTEHDALHPSRVQHGSATISPGTASPAGSASGFGSQDAATLSTVAPLPGIMHAQIAAGESNSSHGQAEPADSSSSGKRSTVVQSEDLCTATSSQRNENTLQQVLT